VFADTWVVLELRPLPQTGSLATVVALVASARFACAWEFRSSVQLASPTVLAFLSPILSSFFSPLQKGPRPARVLVPAARAADPFATPSRCTHSNGSFRQSPNSLTQETEETPTIGMLKRC